MPNIIIVSNTCSNSYFAKLQNIKKNEKLSPSQKYFNLLIDGLIGHDCDITCVSARSIDPSNYEGKIMGYYEEIEKKVKYIYPKVINIKFLKNIANMFYGKKIVEKLIKGRKKDDTIFLIDPLAYDISYGVLKVIKKWNKCMIVTDLPSQLISMNKNNKSGIVRKIKLFLMNSIMKNADCFCFLTHSMSIVGLGKPYVLIEGMIGQNNDFFDNTNYKNIVLYAGGLYENFGVRKLVDAFKTIDSNLELHLYGEGPLVDYILETSKSFKSILYKGVLDSKSIFQREKEAKILINPRPSNEDFTRYSFPSKTIEYMSTGRPVLTTKLFGIPKDYYPYLFFIEDESVEGIKDSIEKLDRSITEANVVGNDARNFIYTQKNNTFQAKKMLCFFDNIFNYKK